MATSNIIKQRIKYLVEFGGLCPDDQPASHAFVLRWVLVLMCVNVLDFGLQLMRFLT